MATQRYFAYGSNMLRERLVARVSTARAVAVGVVRDFRLDFAKVSVDHSGKGDMVSSPGGEVWGVLYEFDAAQKESLDEHEGRDYSARKVVVATSAGDETARAYIAEPHRRDAARVPYDWYLALIVTGAEQNELPTAYVEQLRHTPTMSDPEKLRPTRLDALMALCKAGYEEVVDGLES